MSKEGRGLKFGDWYAHCDVCDRRFFGSTMRLRWDNLFVCSDDYEERQPQDFVKSGREDRNVPISRPAKEVTNALNTALDIDNDGGNWYNGGNTIN